MIFEHKKIKFIYGISLALLNPRDKRGVQNYLFPLTSLRHYHRHFIVKRGRGFNFSTVSNQTSLTHSVEATKSSNLWQETSDMAVIVNVQFSIQPGKREQAVAFLDKNLPDTRSYDGCQWLYSATDIEDENKWEFFSLWESKEKYDTYLQWRMDSAPWKNLQNLSTANMSGGFLIQRIHIHKKTD